MGLIESDRDEVRLRDCQVIINTVSITRANWHSKKTVLIKMENVSLPDNRRAFPKELQL